MKQTQTHFSVGTQRKLFAYGACYLLFLVCACGSRGVTNDVNSKFERVIKLKGDRDLSSEESNRMVQPESVLLDKTQRQSDREKAANLIGLEVAHVRAVPALLSVASDTKEAENVRYWALTSLSQVADKSVVPILLTFLEDTNVNIRGRANEQLRKMSSGVVYESLADTVPENQRAKTVAKWKQWWERNKETFVVDRSKVLIER